MVAPPSDVANFDAPASAMSTTAAEKRTKKHEQPTATQPKDCQKKSGKTLFPTSMGAKHNGSAILNMPRSESPLQTTSVGEVYVVCGGPFCEKARQNTESRVWGKVGMRRVGIQLMGTHQDSDHLQMKGPDFQKSQQQSPTRWR
jgi:hypothetical protein